ncbi:MAG TPA: hypothetical protein VGJ18_07870, partial [Gemmatimonadaceae bacterium]
IATVRGKLGRPDLAPAFRDRATAALDQLDFRTAAAERSLFQSRVTEQLLFLAEDVSSSDYAPTAAHAQVYAELHAELLSSIASANDIVEREVPNYNALIGTQQDFRIVAAP